MVFIEDFSDDKEDDKTTTIHLKENNLLYVHKEVDTIDMEPVMVNVQNPDVSEERQLNAEMKTPEVSPILPHPRNLDRIDITSFILVRSILCLMLRSYQT